MIVVTLTSPFPNIPCSLTCLAEGDSRGYEGISRLYGRQREKKSRVYLEGLVSEGFTCGNVLCAIGMYYMRSPGYPSKALEYYEQAAASGSNTAYEHICKIYDGRRVEKASERLDLFLLNFLIARKCGLYSSSIWWEYLLDLYGDKSEPLQEALALGGYGSRAEMHLDYCNYLIQKHVPFGYRLKSEVYSRGIDRPSNNVKSLRILEEADELGLLDLDGYLGSYSSKLR